MNGHHEIQKGFTGPSVIDIILDPTHFKHRDFESRVLADVYHINKLKPAILVRPTRYIGTQN